MAKRKKQTDENAQLEAGIYKGYDIRWLRQLGEEHPAFHLVAEYDEKYQSAEEESTDEPVEEEVEE